MTRKQQIRIENAKTGLIKAAKRCQANALHIRILDTIVPTLEEYRELLDYRKQQLADLEAAYEELKAAEKGEL